MSSLHCINPLCFFLSNSLSAPHQKGHLQYKKKKRPANTPCAPISSTSFLCPASRHGAAHRLINFPLWFHHQVKLKWHNKVLFCNRTSFTTETTWKSESPSCDQILKVSDLKKIIKKSSWCKQIHNLLFYSLNNENCFRSHRVLGFKVSMKHKPFKQIKFQIKQAM